MYFLRLSKNPLGWAFSTKGLLPWGTLLAMVGGSEFTQPLEIQSFCCGRKLACTPCAKRLFLEKGGGFSFLTVCAMYLLFNSFLL